MERKYLYGSVDYSSLVKARNTLSRILQTSQNEAEKMGVVKAFEICYELSWKIVKKILEFRGVEADTARDVFREAARLKLLFDAEIWFSYIAKRNITVHAYQPEILDELFSNTTKEFLQDLDYLLKQIEKEAPKYATNRK
ncbi:MAG: nucleotidyltransferase substrate binding protein [Candidatus Moeniiplasma glomeromycotorum]|nr:nucleotidyltransferase substrate binding protein [Candidatus Moeniiplasma glomeromycotorum]MCE8169318.1 nucleotidyltransferase substrate binding protein [Candidatus Moeniiplasma glomeromycotorum]